MRRHRYQFDLANLLSLFRPLYPECVLCRRRRKPTEDGTCCFVCADKVPYIKRVVCAHCGRADFCHDCDRLLADHRNPPALAFHRSAARYDSFLKFVIAQYKYRGHERLRNLLKDILKHGFELLQNQLAVQEDRYTETFDMITFVPISGPRAHERGFNQAEQLAEELSEVTGLPVMSLLRREKHAPKQSQQTRIGRLKVSHQVFAFDEEVWAKMVSEQQENNQVARMLTLDRPLRIIIVDDVYTTGTTLEACAGVLKTRLGSHVYGLTLARA